METKKILKLILVYLLIFFLNNSFLFAQDTTSNGKALNFPTKLYGISIGNSTEFNGIRINFADKNVKKINGFNFTIWKCKDYAWEHKRLIYSSIVNGISIGVSPTEGSMQPLNFGVLRVAAEKNLNGLSVSGFNIWSNEHIYGISIAGLGTKADIISGIAISGFGVGGMKGINGIAIGGIGIFTSKTGDVNGVASCLGVLHCGNTFRGIGLSGVYLKSNLFKGIAIAGFTKTNQMYGLSIAVFNKTDELHGFQIGLLNYAKNNPKGLKWLPLVNIHFGKK